MGELLDWLVANDESFRKARLPSLYSDFRRQKATNPDGYAANIATWRSGLCRAAAARAISGENCTLSLQVNERLLQTLRSTTYGMPSALSSVVEEGLAHTQLVPIDAFLGATSSIYDRSWTLPSASEVISWALRRLGLSGLVNGQPAQARYVLVANVEAATSKLESYLSQPRSKLERLIPRDVVRKDMGRLLGYEKDMPELDFEVLLVHLTRDKRRIVYDDSLVKFCGTSASEAERHITTQDSEIASIKSLQVRLSEQEATLTVRVQERGDEARRYVAQGNKPAAVRALRAKKQQETVLERRVASREQIDGVIDRIQDAADQVEMVRAMESSAAVLKSLNAETGGRENVERIMDRLQEELDQAEDIGATIQVGGAVGTPVDEAEVDDELAALEEESKAEQSKAKEERVKAQLNEIPATPQAIGEKVEEEEQKGSVEKLLESDIASLGKLSIEERDKGPDSKEPLSEREPAPAT